MQSAAIYENIRSRWAFLMDQKLLSIESTSVSLLTIAVHFLILSDRSSF